MKKFINKQTEIKQQDENGESSELTYTELAIITVNLTPKDGWLMKEMRQRFKLEDKLKGKEVGEIVELDDADVEKLVKLADIPWSFKHKDIIEYVTYLEELMKD